MIDMRLLKPNLIYRVKAKYRIPVLHESPTTNSVYVVISKTIDDTIKFFNKDMIDPLYLIRYYHERLFNYKIHNHIIRYRIPNEDLKDIFDNKVKSIFPSMDIRYTIESLNKKNFIYEMSYLNDKFFSIKDSQIGLKKVDEYFRLFKSIIADKLTGNVYTNKIMFIPIDDWVSNIKNSALYQIRTTDNFISLFYHKVVNDAEYFKNNFSGWKFYFTFGNQIFYIDPATMNTDFANTFKKILFKLTALDIKIPIEEKEEIHESIEVKNKTIIQDKIHEKLNSSSIDPTKDLVLSLVDKTIEKLNINIQEKKLDDIAITDIPSIKEIELERLQDEIKNTIPNYKSKARVGREIQMIQDMSKITLDNTSISEVQDRYNASKIETTVLDIDVVNPDLANMKFSNFDTAYLKTLYTADILKMMTSLQHKDHPLYLINAEVKDISDTLNDLEEYSFTFEDENGKRHSFIVDLPKVTNGRFMKIAGNKKIMVNQIIPIPITKTSPSTVQIATNYGKVFIHRFGQSISPKISILIKKLSLVSNKDINMEIGSAININKGIITSIEYDELSARYRKISIPNITFFFDQNALQEYSKKYNLELKYDNVNLPIGIKKNKEIIYLNIDSNIVSNSDKSIIDYITDELAIYEPSASSWFRGIKTGKKLVYSRANIMHKKVPVIILLAYLEGLITLMKKANIKYSIIAKDESPNLPKFIQGKEDIIEFKNAWLVYNIYPLRNSLLMNGMIDIPTKLYDIEQFLTKDVYYEIFDSLFGRGNIGYAFDNFQQLLIDSNTEEILRDYNLPTNFTDVFIYGNSLLEDNSYTEDGDMTVNRIRSNEMITAFLYQSLAKAYGQYRFTANNPNPTKLSTRKNSVIIDILTSQVTKDYSDLNPLYTLDLMRSTTFKGPAGMNQDRAFTLSKRSFHPSMLGIISQASPISGAIGIARTLTVDASVTSARGYMKVADTKEDINNLSSKQLLSGSELMIPFLATSDDPERVAMASAQSKHTLACIGSDRSPVGTGFEKVLPHIIGDTFVFKAKQDGVVLKIDTVHNIAILKYSDNTIDTVNLNPQIGKNSGSGFYISNKLSPILKTGDKFKAGKIIAHNSEFFSVDKRSGDSVFMHGPLARVAVRYSSKVFEDSNIISKRLSEKMTSHIVIQTDVVLGHKSNIHHMVKKGQEIRINEPLIVFDTSHSDELTNKILAKMSDSSIQDLMEAAKTPVLSKHNGVIEDIKIYYTVPKDELSESAKNIITEYEDINLKMKNEISSITKIDKDKINTNVVEVTKVDIDASGKVKGVVVNSGVKIEFYIKYKDVMSVGDKGTGLIALKYIIADMFEEGKEPYLLSDPDDKIDIYLGAIGIGARLVFSIIKNMKINNIIIGMKKNIKEMYEDAYGEKL